MERDWVCVALVAVRARSGSFCSSSSSSEGVAVWRAGGSAAGAMSRSPNSSALKSAVADSGAAAKSYSSPSKRALEPV